MRALAVLAAAVLLAAVLLATGARAQTAVETDLSGVLHRAGLHATDYYVRARTIVSRETVRLQPLDRQLRPSQDWRQLVYEMRVEWDPSRPGEPIVTRQPLSKGGRLETLTGRDVDCFDLKEMSVEPLAMLLPDRQKAYTFTSTGPASGRPPVAVLDFTQTPVSQPSVTWRGRCGTIDLRGNTLGRVWIEHATGAVLRIDERLARPFPYVMPLDDIVDRHPVSQTVDRLEISIRYKLVTFKDPVETVMLPASIRTLSVIHNGGLPQLLVLQSYGDYRRFMTTGRVVK